MTEAVAEAGVCCPASICGTPADGNSASTRIRILQRLFSWSPPLRPCVPFLRRHQASPIHPRTPCMNKADQNIPSSQPLRKQTDVLSSPSATPTGKTYANYSSRSTLSTAEHLSREPGARRTFARRFCCTHWTGDGAYVGRTVSARGISVCISRYSPVCELRVRTFCLVYGL